MEERTIDAVMEKATVGYTPGKTALPIPHPEYDVVPPIPTAATIDFDEALKELTMATTSMEKTAALKKMEVTAGNKLKNLIGTTNLEFKRLQDQNPKTKQFAVNGCVFKGYTRPATYNYPKEVLEHAAALKGMKSIAEKDGAAIRKNVQADIETDKMFSVSLMPDDA